MSLSERPYLSIGEVLGLLLEEFPDVTISKIRFLESQGLIDPERTPSGYRKFYDPDVDRLRVILREQRENFLPLRVIRDRLESGEIDETGGHTPPRGVRNVTLSHPSAGASTGDQDAQATEDHMDDDADDLDDVDDTDSLDAPSSDAIRTSSHPAAQQRVVPAPPPPPPERSNVSSFFAPGGEVPPTQLPVERSEYTAGDVCALARLTARQLGELESFGLVKPLGSGTSAVYSPMDLEIATVAAKFLERGVEARHLRPWRQAAEREASLFEQLISPLLRQRNPQSRQQASETLVTLSELGAELRAVFLRAALREHLDD
ncbi:MAG: MerR family transcriptional regulator [Ilumatobacteraceae bacterium]